MRNLRLQPADVRSICIAAALVVLVLIADVQPEVVVGFLIGLNESAPMKTER